MLAGSLPHLPLLLLLLLGQEPAPAAAEELEEVVIPQEVGLEEVGVLLKPGHLRERRWFPSGAAAAAAEHLPLFNQEELAIHLPAFGRDFYLHLERDLRFLAPGFQVEEKRGESSSSLTPLADAQLCFYTGQVLNHSNTFAAVSACGGLIGSIQIGEEQLLIQPVNISEGSFSGRQHHIRLKRSSTSHLPDELRAPNSSRYCHILSETA